MRTATIHHRRAYRAGAAASVAAAGLLLLAACGSGGSTASASTGGGSGSGSGMTVTVQNAGGMKLLATNDGRTLYSSDQEKGMVLCTSGACHAIWKPLTLSAGQKPTAPSGVASHLTTVKEASGSEQVAFDGQPLYTFSFDHGAGDANGNGQHDAFDGTSFSWHAVTPAGAAAASNSGPSGYSSGSSRGNGYGY